MLYHTETTSTTGLHNNNGEWRWTFESRISTLKEWCMGHIYWNLGPPQKIARYISDFFCLINFFKTVVEVLRWLIVLFSLYSVCRLQQAKCLLG